MNNTINNKKTDFESEFLKKSWFLAQKKIDLKIEIWK